jgi:8-oxo-dGTP pyrophosphatase MutT (NUDIX family)
MQVGESYEESAAREVGEELGVRGVELRPLFDMWFEDERSAVWGRAFTCVYDGPLELQVEEVQFVEPMTPSDVLRRAREGEHFTPDGLLVVERFLRQDL